MSATAAVDEWRPWRVVAVATLAQATSAFVFVGVGTLAAFVQADLGLSGTRTGLLVTAGGLMPLATMLFVGRLLDRYGERWLVAAGGVLLAVGAALATQVHDYWLLTGLLLIGGTGYASAQPGGSSAVAGWFPGERRGLAMGIRQTGLPLGGAAAAAALPWLAGRYDWRTALLIAAAVAAIGGVVFAVVYRDHPLRAPSTTPLVPAVRRLLTMSELRPVLWSGVTHVAVQFAVVSYMLIYLRDRHGIALAAGGACLFAAQMAGVAGRIALARWSDVFGTGRRLRPVLCASLVTAAGTALLAVLPPTSLTVMVIVSAAFGFFAFGWYGSWVVHVADVAPAEATGLTLALAMTGNQLGIVAGPPLFGAIHDVSGGFVVPWLTLSMLLVVVAARIAIAVRCGNA